MASWYYMKDGRPQGPMDSTALCKLIAGGKLRPTDHIRQEGEAQWTVASEVDGLFNGDGSPGASVIAAVTTADVLLEPKDRPLDSRRARTPMRAAILCGVVVVVVAVGVGFWLGSRQSTTPSKQHLTPAELMVKDPNASFTAYGDRFTDSLQKHSKFQIVNGFVNVEKTTSLTTPFVGGLKLHFNRNGSSVAVVTISFAAQHGKWQYKEFEMDDPSASTYGFGDASHVAALIKARVDLISDLKTAIGAASAETANP